MAYEAAPSDDCAYGNISFWEERYLSSKCEIFDWYQGNYEALGLGSLMKKEDQVLIAGCGTSRLGPDMYDGGFENIYNVDASRAAISAMEKRYSPKIKEGLGGLRWKQGDCRYLGGLFDSESFDVVLDKALFDALDCADQRSKRMYLAEVARLLTPTGKFICISHGPPEQRLRDLENHDDSSKAFLPWKVSVRALPKQTIQPFTMPSLTDLYYVYICQKTQDFRNKSQRHKKNIKRPGTRTRHDHQ